MTTYPAQRLTVYGYNLPFLAELVVLAAEKEAAINGSMSAAGGMAPAWTEALLDRLWPRLCKKSKRCGFRGCFYPYPVVDRGLHGNL